jgi:tetratricopeptide (TPR) repeat protein
MGELQQVRSYHEQQLEIAQEIGDRQLESSALGYLGNAYAALDDSHQAIAFYEQQLEIARELKDRHGESVALGNLGNVYVDLGDSRQAIPYYEQQLEIAGEIGDQAGEAVASWNLGDEHAKLGHLAQAVPLLEAGLAFLQEYKHREVGARAAYVAQVRKRLEAAEPQRGQRLGTPPTEAGTGDTSGVPPGGAGG